MSVLRPASALPSSSSLALLVQRTLSPIQSSPPGPVLLYAASTFTASYQILSLASMSQEPIATSVDSIPTFFSSASMPQQSISVPVSLNINYRFVNFDGFTICFYIPRMRFS